MCVSALIVFRGFYEATRNLDKAFNDQFASGHVDPSVLSKEIDDLVQAMPEDTRATVEAQIDKAVKNPILRRRVRELEKIEEALHI